MYILFKYIILQYLARILCVMYILYVTGPEKNQPYLHKIYLFSASVCLVSRIFLVREVCAFVCPPPRVQITAHVK